MFCPLTKNACREDCVFYECSKSPSCLLCGLVRKMVLQEDIQPVSQTSEDTCDVDMDV